MGIPRMNGKALRLVTPVVLVAFAFGWLWLWLGSDLLGTLPITVRLLLVLLTAVTTYVAVQLEEASPGIATHLRQAALLYVLLLIGLVDQGEGLTAPGGRQFMLVSAIMLIGNALTIGVLRLVNTMTSRRRT